MRRVLIACLMVLGLAMPGPAGVSDGAGGLLAALRLADMVEVMRAEGLAHGARMEQELFVGRGGERWAVAVSDIYDSARMLATLTDTLERDLAREDKGPLATFLASGRGSRVVAREIEARWALLDPDIEAASLERLRDMRANRDPRLDLLGRVIGVNDLVEQNVVGAMNANFAFYAGLAEGGAFARPPTEDEMLRDVWEQEPEIRAETEQWLYSYLALAYAPLSDAVLDEYVALSRSAEGQALNGALFAGFDRAFSRISHELGVVAARFVAGEDI
ncbi:hypothetical protein EV663_10925 [Rhodovulum bhavnagarense]|uniref:DUF2059 domain-containing protein n=1 Tax=Rhodovulum bhavnagarense TaxID=992286 RepID=A0A4R2RE57_9RHOB|nr:hypothetical protein [Rhodovulum bhavnagarense]TCP60519.1 hypothetical protein EV663_10925 [Rhodovulum bhavnagarense]